VSWCPRATSRWAEHDRRALHRALVPHRGKVYCQGSRFPETATTALGVLQPWPLPSSRLVSRRNQAPMITRLKRIEDLLIEMRGVLDFQLKRIGVLQKQVDILIENNAVRRTPRVTRGRKKQ